MNRNNRRRHSRTHVPQFNQQSGRKEGIGKYSINILFVENDNFDSISELHNLRITENQSGKCNDCLMSFILTNFYPLSFPFPVVSSTVANSNDLALLVNLDEILGNMTDSFHSTPRPSRQQTPALSEADPGVEIEVRLEDLGTYDIQGVNWNNFAVSRDDYRSIR